MPSKFPTSPAILIVDDSPHNLQVAGETLSRRLACELSFATDGQMALDSIREAKPDLILLDVMMPGLGGFEVCRILKSDPQTDSIPVIFLTAKAEPDDIVAGFKAGGADYVTKPFHQEELLARVTTCLELLKATRAIEAKNAELNHLLRVLCHDLANPIWALCGLLKISEEEPALLRENIPELHDISRQAMEQIELVRKMHSLESSRFNLPLAPVPLLDAVRAAERSLRRKFSEKELRLACAIPAGLSVEVERVSFTHSVLTNFLSNAAKFSFRGGEVLVRAGRADAGGVRVEICDTGKGIPKAKIAEMFSPRALYSTAGTEGEPGTGFGMPLAKRFVEAYGGRLEISSRDSSNHPGRHGTTITLWLRGG